MLYRTRVIRYVPDTARGEFLNLGVVVMGEDPGDVAVRTVETLGQIPEIGGPREAALHSITSLRRELECFAGEPAQLEVDDTATPRSYLSGRFRNAYGLIQYSDEGIADGQTATAVANFLFEHLIARGMPARRHRRLPQLRRRVTDSYTEYPVIADHLISKPTLDAGARHGEMDLAVVGENILELNSAFSFRGQPTPQARERVDAWSFRMERLRNDGGHLRRGNSSSIRVAADTPIVAVVEMPETPLQVELYREVTAPWPGLDITPVTPDQLGVHARDLEARLTAA